MVYVTLLLLKQIPVTNYSPNFHEVEGKFIGNERVILRDIFRVRVT